MSRSLPAERRGTRLAAALVIAGVVLAAVACQDDRAPSASQAMGDADHGRGLFVEYGCATCHQVSGIRQANGRVGPNLDGISDQRIIAGVLPNTPEYLSAWIQQPREYAPNSAMPDLGVSPEDAGHMTAFLLER